MKNEEKHNIRVVVLQIVILEKLDVPLDIQLKSLYTKKKMAMTELFGTHQMGNMKLLNLSGAISPYKRPNQKGDNIDLGDQRKEVKTDINRSPLPKKRRSPNQF